MQESGLPKNLPKNFQRLAFLQARKHAFQSSITNEVVAHAWYIKAIYIHLKVENIIKHFNITLCM